MEINYLEIANVSKVGNIEKYHSIKNYALKQLSRCRFVIDDEKCLVEAIYEEEICQVVFTNELSVYEFAQHLKGVCYEPSPQYMYDQIRIFDCTLIELLEEYKKNHYISGRELMNEIWYKIYNPVPHSCKYRKVFDATWIDYEKQLRSDSVEQFYCSLTENEELRRMKIYGVLEESCMKFYNVCARFADISLNAHKYRIPGTCDIQGCFQFKDIEKAKWIAKEFYTRKSIEDVDELLRAIRLMYRIAVDFDDARCSSAVIKPENTDNSYGYFGTYYNFAEMPQNIWEDVEKETREFIQTP